MIDQLKELLQMQKELDERILQGKLYPAEQMKIALFVELGEMMQELPSYFKHWKKNAVDNREKALEEYVDALHIQLSLFSFYRLERYVEICNYEYTDDDELQDFSICLQSAAINYDNAMGLMDLFCLGRKLGFTWEEIYRTYKAKNKINHERQDNGY